MLVNCKVVMKNRKVFKFAAINNYNGPTGLIFWCVDVTGLAKLIEG